MTVNAVHGWATTLLKLASDWEQAQWLVDQIQEIAEFRPSPAEMRRVFATKFLPADGKDPVKGTAAI